VGKNAGKWFFRLQGWQVQVFQGSALISIDAKGRIAVPSRHRTPLAELGGKLTLTAHPEGNLMLYRDPDWYPVRERISALPSTHPANRGLQLVVVGMAEEGIELDGNGRILIPPPLRKHAKLDKELIFVGQGNRFEMWDTGAWDRMLAELPAHMAAADLPPSLQNFSL
jgi:MraZ protein